MWLRVRVEKRGRDATVRPLRLLLPPLLLRIPRESHRGLRFRHNQSPTHAVTVLEGQQKRATVLAAALPVWAQALQG